MASSSGIGFEGLWRPTSSKSSIRTQMTRSAAGYKLMREQLCENLSRLGELQCVATRKSCLANLAWGHLGAFPCMRSAAFIMFSYVSMCCDP